MSTPIKRNGKTVECITRTFSGCKVTVLYINPFAMDKGIQETSFNYDKMLPNNEQSLRKIQNDHNRADRMIASIKTVEKVEKLLAISVDDFLKYSFEVQGREAIEQAKAEAEAEAKAEAEAENN